MERETRPHKETIFTNTINDRNCTFKLLYNESFLKSIVDSGLLKKKEKKKEKK